MAVNKTISFQRKFPCGTCKGTKMKPNTTKQKCMTCDGTGEQAMIINDAIFEFMWVLSSFKQKISIFEQNLNIIIFD